MEKLKLINLYILQFGKSHFNLNKIGIDFQRLK